MTAVAAIVLFVLTLSGIALWRTGGSNPDPITTVESSFTATAPPSSVPLATATVTIFVTPLNTPPAAAVGADGGNEAAWLAALGAIIAGLGTVASGAAALATVRRDTGGGGRRIHRRSEGRTRRPRRS